MNQRHDLVRQQSGLSYTEILAAIALLAISVLPATNALRGAMDTAEADLEATMDHFRLVTKLEEVLALPFPIVSAQAAASSEEE